MDIDEMIESLSPELQNVLLYNKITTIGLNNLMKYKKPDIETNLITKLNNELDKMDKNIQKKWNLESRFYLTDAEDRMYGKRSNLISDYYHKVNTLEELNNENFLNDLKSIINNHVKINIKENNLNEDIENKILSDVNIQIDKLVNDFSENHLIYYTQKYTQ